MATKHIHVHGTSAQPGDPDLFWKSKVYGAARPSDFRSGIQRSQHGTTFWSHGTLASDGLVWVHVPVALHLNPDLPSGGPKRKGLTLDSVVVFFESDDVSLEVVRVTGVPSGGEAAPIVGEIKRSLEKGEYRKATAENTFKFAAEFKPSSLNVALGLRYMNIHSSPVGGPVGGEGRSAAVEGTSLLLRGIVATISGNV